MGGARSMYPRCSEVYIWKESRIALAWLGLKTKHLFSMCQLSLFLCSSCTCKEAVGILSQVTGYSVKNTSAWEEKLKNCHQSFAPGTCAPIIEEIGGALWEVLIILFRCKGPRWPTLYGQLEHGSWWPPICPITDVFFVMFTATTLNFLFNLIQYKAWICWPPFLVKRGGTQSDRMFTIQ